VLLGRHLRERLYKRCRLTNGGARQRRRAQRGVCGGAPRAGSGPPAGQARAVRRVGRDNRPSIR
jgi:hypothetical protein